MSYEESLFSETVAPAVELRWFAVRTRSNHERIAVSQLGTKGITAYVPTMHQPSRRVDRRLVLERPLFPGYFFTRTDLSRAARVEILRAPGVVTMVGFGDGPVPIPDWQIRSIQAVLSRRNPFEVLFKLVSGRRVRVVSGPLAGVEGVVAAAPNGKTRLVISIEILGRSIAAQIDSEQVEPLL